MTETQRISLKGWKSWQSRRRKQLRATRGFSMSRATQTALHETRCRAQIAQVIGRPAAKRLDLLTLECGDPYGYPYFLLTGLISNEIWKQLAHISDLLRVVVETPE